MPKGDQVPTKREAAITAKVVQAREKAGLERKALAEALSLDLNSYGHYERGRYAFTIDQLFVISSALGRPVEFFLGLDTGLAEDEAQVVHLWRQIESPALRENTLTILRAQAEADRRMRGGG